MNLDFKVPKPGEWGMFPSKEGKSSVVELDKKDIWNVKETIFTAVFPPDEEPDPKLVEACRKVDPNFVVIWCTRIMLTPAGTEEKTGHYIICRYVPSSQDPDDVKRPLVLSNWPSNFPFDPKRIFELESWTIKWPKGSFGAKMGLPETGKPFDNRVVEYVKAQEDFRNNHNPQDVLRLLAIWEENDQKMLRGIMEDAEYQLKQDWKEMKKCVEEGRLLPPIWEKKPFADAPSASFEVN